MGAKLEAAMSVNVETFDKRLNRVTRKHQAMSRGYTFRLDKKSGLVSIKPKRAKGASPISLFLAVLMIGLLFKAVVLANIGPAAYDDKVAALRSGTVVEQASVYLLDRGNMTNTLATFVGGFLR